MKGDNRGGCISARGFAMQLLVVFVLLLELFSVLFFSENLEATYYKSYSEQPPIEGTTKKCESDHAMDWKLPEDLQNERTGECENSKISKTGGFCLDKKKHVGGNHMYDESLADYFATAIFKGDSVVDLGAGLGHYGKLLQNHETVPVKSWAGYDGAINVQSATDGLVRFMDLTQPGPADERPCGGKASWVMSLEVAEHIPPEFTDSFLRNIRCRAEKGAVISWALPTQRGGLGHVNMKTEEQAIELVKRWGFEVDWELTNGARASATVKHFKHSVVVYRLVG